MLKMIFAALIAALIALTWSFVSWSVLPWHQLAIKTFNDENAVLQVLKENAQGSGVYMSPNFNLKDLEWKNGEREQGIESRQNKMNAGSILLAQLRLGGIDPMSIGFQMRAFFIQFLGGFCICFLLKNAKDLGFFGRVFFVTVVGLTIGILSVLPSWNWFGVGWKYSFVMIGDYTATWFFAGIFLATIYRNHVIPKSEHLM